LIGLKQIWIVWSIYRKRSGHWVLVVQNASIINAQFARKTLLEIVINVIILKVLQQELYFIKVKFGLRKSFGIVFEMSATTKSISANQMSKRYEIRYITAWLFMQKVRDAMKSSESQPMKGEVIVDEFVFGGKEDLKQGRSSDSRKKKIVAAVEKDIQGIKRVYFKVIKDYSCESLREIFDTHISKDANINTDQWTGYKPLQKEYKITQTKSDKGNTFFEMNTIVHQVKAWLRSTFSNLDKHHIQAYLNEFSYRINRSIHKQTIFDNLISRMILAKPLTYKDITISN